MSETDAPQLKRPLPPQILQALQPREITEDDVIIATNTDLDIPGEYSESWVVATKDLVLVFRLDEEDDEAILQKEIRMEEIETVRTDTRVGSGFLEAKSNSIFEELARFSNKNAEKFAKVSQRLKSLAEGRQVQVGPEDDIIEGRCEKCGCRLPEKHMKVCPKCLKRGTVFLRFLGLTKDYWPYATAAMVLVVMTIMIQLIPAQLVGVLIDNVFGDQPLTPWFGMIAGLLKLTTRSQWLVALVSGLALVYLIGGIVTGLRETLAVWIANRLGFDLRQEVFRKLEDLAIRYHDIHPVGQLMTRCSQDVEALQGFVNQLTSGFGYQILLVIGVAVMMFAKNWQLGLWAVAPAPVVMGVTAFYYRRILPGWRKYWSARSSLSNILHGSLNGIRVVKAFAQETRECERFGRYSGKFRDAGLDVGFATARFGPLVGFVFQLGSLGIWLVGGTFILNTMNAEGTSKLTIGDLMIFLNYLGLFYAPLNSLTQMSTWFTSFTTQAHRVFEVLDEDPEVVESNEAVDIEIQGAIAFKDVTFGYDPHIPILKDVSFTVLPGEMIGIVGHSGSGKSTTVNLINRFYDPQEGTISVDNIDINRIRKRCLRRQIGLVAQDPFLFRGTIAENIAYGNPEVAPELVLNAALSANSHMFITRIHDGYDSLLGEHGSGLSGGERQRVAIARGLLHNPRILILDEATSSVDTIAEREIQKALESLSRGRTTIAIAHRLSTLRNCDRIIVFEEGQVRENGTHEELLAQRGIYWKLIEIQSQLNNTSVVDVEDPAALDQLQAEQNRERAAAEKAAERQRLEVPRIRYLNAKDVHIFSMDEGGMRVMYGDEVYDHVRAYRCFPVTRPSEFIALWTGDSALEHEEIGVIRRIKQLAPSSRLAVEHELAKRYFIHYVQEIRSIKEEVGFLVWNVKTDKGDIEFMTKRFDRDTVIEGPVNGRIIFDLDKNRYEIEDLDALDAASLATFLRHIYW
jgi:ATP-binding cassette, subfamily B, bacterial